MLSTLRRGWYLPALAAVVAAAVALALVAWHPAPYVSVGSVALPAGDAAGADARVTQAFTVAQILAEDPAVGDALAARLGVSRADADRYSVEVVESTTLIKLRFEADTAAAAREGMAALEAVLTGPSPVSNGVPAGTLVVTRPPEPPFRDGVATWEAVAVAGLLGLVLGAVIAVARERSRP
jgi:hypothetical protein